MSKVVHVYLIISDLKLPWPPAYGEVRHFQLMDIIVGVTILKMQH